MPTYFDTITDVTDLTLNKAANLEVSGGFEAASAALIGRCSALQSEVQSIIYVAHGAELIASKRALRQHLNPKARLDFLCSFPFQNDDAALVRVFNFAREMFGELYALRNVLAHEVWNSSPQFPDAVLFTTLDEESRKLLAEGRLWHFADATPEQIHAAIIRFIRKVRVVRPEQLAQALSDSDICSWTLMTLRQLLNTEDRDKREQTRQALAIFGATAHLFDRDENLPPKIAVANATERRITEPTG